MHNLLWFFLFQKLTELLCNKSINLGSNEYIYVLHVLATVVLNLNCSIIVPYYLLSLELDVNN